MISSTKWKNLVNTFFYIKMIGRDVLFEYHRAVVPFCWAAKPVRSLLTGIPFQNLRWNSNKTSLVYNSTGWKVYDFIYDLLAQFMIQWSF